MVNVALTPNQTHPPAAANGMTGADHRTSEVRMTDQIVTLPDSSGNPSTPKPQFLSIHDYGDFAFVYGPDNKHVDSATYLRLLDLLKTAERAARAEDAMKMARALEWVQPDDWRDYKHVKQCVYIVRPMTRNHSPYIAPALAKEWTHVVKIGMTNNGLMRRRKELSKHYGGSLRVLAYAETDNPLRTERGLHAMFHHANVHGEWFDVSAVAEFILGRAP
jgi:hypothetical protein